MTKFWKTCSCVLLLSSAVWVVHGDSTYAGSAMTSDSSGTRSVLITGRNGGAGGVAVGAGSLQGRVGPGSSVSGGVIQSRLGGGSTYSGGSVRSPTGTYAATGGGGGAYAGPAGAYAGAGGAFASAGGAYAGASPWGFPYWNGGSGSYASASAGGGSGPYYNQPYPYNPYPSGGGGDEVGVYSDSDGIQTRFGNLGPGGRATIVEQNGDEEPRVYTYRGADRNYDY